ncbi:hypothetical protein OIU77_019251 [Salix suchowensis]|uniref:Phosphatidic acid phosphatase type 2/haloperoxidase domain-containing protein n=1 Tax=Salix suchowensis TaxID=1278906 RepID=A0ABQ9CIR5_9ROSI|nr:hypothetical protein OIU77_019251 [Salix suchowensis]
MWAASGSVVNSILSVILKRILNQERPDSASRSDPGMPSSHGQSIFFTVVFAILSVGEWLSVNEFTLIISASILAFDVVTCLTRTSYNQPSCGRCCCRVNFLHFVVLVLGGIGVERIYLLSLGSYGGCYGSCCILPSFSCACYWLLFQR